VIPAVAPAGTNWDFLMVAVTRGYGTSVDVDDCLWVAEVPGIPEWQVQGRR
jgi:hypothetical protein